MTDTLTGKLTGSTRRSFISGIAAAGASTATAVALERAGLDMFGDGVAHAAGPPTAFSEFDAIGPSSADALQVADGFTAQVLIGYGDTFTNAAGDELMFGYNNDFLAFFPLKGKSDEGILFVNHEYPGPFYQHGYKPTGAGPGRRTKTAEQIQLEKDSVGNSFIHLQRSKEGAWEIVHGSPYNRRIYGDRPDLQITGPLRGPEDFTAPVQKVGTTSAGSLGNCSGGITPWGTALSCEENYDGYGIPIPNSASFAYGWEPENYDQNQNKTYGYVVEHDPYSPSNVGRKHTALGRFRHENTAFRAATGRKFVLYMGDDANNEGVYKFVSDRAYVPNDRANNLKILESGTLYIAEWLDSAGAVVTNGAGRRRFAGANSTGAVLSPTSGRGTWVEVADADLVDTRARLRALYGVDNYVDRFATNRPEDVEVDEDGIVYVALTNNSGGSDTSSRGSRAAANDVHGSVRRMVESDGNPEATTFTWREFAVGGPTGRADEGEAGFSSPDNLVFDQGDNVWVVTDISSGSLNKPSVPHYQYHGNNALFMVPRSGPNAGVAFRFANMPIEAEGTGPYFTPDEQTLFLAVQHPGEESGEGGSPSIYGDVSTYTSYWPQGNKTIEQNPSTPLPSVVAIYRPVGKDAEPEPVVPVPPPGKTPDGSPAPVPPAPGPGGDGPAGPANVRVRPLQRFSVRDLLTGRLVVRLTSPQKVTVDVRVRGRVRSRRPGAKRSRLAEARTLASRRVVLQPGQETRVALRPTAAARLVLRRRGASVVNETLQIVARNDAGRLSRSSRQLRIG